MLHAFLPIAAVCGLLVQPTQAESMDSLAVEADLVDSSSVKADKDDGDRAMTRIPKKVGVGALTTAGLGLVFLTLGEETGGGDGIGVAAAVYAAQFFGYPIGVYLADRQESSFWMTFIGNSLGWWGAAKLLGSPNHSELSEWAALIAVFGMPVLASELSRMDAVTGGPKRPKQSQNLLFSFRLASDVPRNLLAIVTLRF